MVLNISRKGLKFLSDVSKHSDAHLVNVFNLHEQPITRTNVFQNAFYCRNH